MHSLTQEGRARVEDIARRHGVGTDAVLTLLQAVDRGGGTQAQFSHPELGGMGQWSRGGMIMVGDMFNQALKARVDQLCNELADALRTCVMFDPAAPGAGSASWWPAAFGMPSATGSQNDMRYAYFPEARRLAVQNGAFVSVYDTGDHRIGGASQQQGGGEDLAFTSQHGTVRLHDLTRIGDQPPVSGEAGWPSAGSPPVPDAPRSTGYPEPESAYVAPLQGERYTPIDVPAAADEDIIAKIERLHALQQKGILSETEFAAKKTELLARL